MLSCGGLKQDYDDMKMIRDYFSYEHFYVIYCPELVRKEAAKLLLKAVKTARHLLGAGLRPRLPLRQGRPPEV